MDPHVLTRIAEALERLAPPPPGPPDLSGADAFVWQPGTGRLVPVPRVARVGIALLHGVERQKRILLDNTLRFARGLPANNAMLWGARGMGKSSLVKAAHAAANDAAPGCLALIEIHREDIRTLPDLLNALRTHDRRCLILCDDLSFEREDADYKALKSVLDGGIEGRPANVLFYATSNRRHLMPRDMIENERATAITRPRRRRRRCPCPTASACGSASTTAARTISGPWWRATPTRWRCPSGGRRCTWRRTSGR